MSSCPTCHHVHSLTLEDVAKLMACRLDATWVERLLERYRLVAICDLDPDLS